MKTMTYKGKTDLYEANGAFFSSEEAFNAEYVIFVAKYKEIIALKEMGVDNVVCIKDNPERLKNFIRFREGKMNQIIILVKSSRAKDVLAEYCKKPYYVITYVGNANDLQEQVSVKDAIESRIENIKLDIENKLLREKIKEQEDDDEDLDAFTDST